MRGAQELVEEAAKLELLWARMEAVDPGMGDELEGAQSGGPRVSPTRGGRVGTEVTASVVLGITPGGEEAQRLQAAWEKMGLEGDLNPLEASPTRVGLAQAFLAADDGVELLPAYSARTAVLVPAAPTVPAPLVPAPQPTTTGLESLRPAVAPLLCAPSRPPTSSSTACSMMIEDTLRDLGALGAPAVASLAAAAGSRRVSPVLQNT